MKLAFSTIGCPGLDWAETCKLAREQGYAGFEVRDLGPRTLTYDKFASSNKAATRAELEAQGLRLTCFSIGKDVRGRAPDKRGDLLDPDTAKSARETARHYIRMAAGLGCPCVRLQIDDFFKDAAGDDATVLGALEELVPFADVLGVTLLVETKGVYSDTKRLRTLLARFRSNAVGALWDVDHTSHSGGETPARTVENLGGLIKYVHLRDSLAQDDVMEYRQGGAAYCYAKGKDKGKALRMGDGDVPLREAMLALRSIDFDGVLSFEWRGRVSRRRKNMTDEAFLRQAAEPYRDFASYMSANFADCLDAGALTYDNLRRDGGKYFWPKRTIIEDTLPQVLDRVCQSFPDQAAFHYNSLEQASQYYRENVRPEGYHATYSAFREDVDIFARSLISLGVCKGDKVAIWCPNLPEWFITFWAAVRIGAVLVTVNTAYKDREMEYLLRQSDTRLLVMSDGVKASDYRAIIHQICPELREMRESKDLYSEKFPMLRNIVTIESRQPGCFTWREAVAKASDVDDAVFAARTAEIDVRDVCNMQYTSGTTGFPKGVMLTHYNIVNNGKTIGDGMDLSTADRLMIQVPMFHCFGMVLAMTAAMTHGTAMYPIPVFSPRLGLQCVREEKITAFHGVPTMFIAMLGHEDFAKTDFSHVRTGIMAGSPCPIKVMRDVLDRMNMREITIVFGQTESSPGCTMSSTEDSIDVRVNTVGSAFFGVECKIVDPETGADLPDDTDGEFVARGYNIMKGYYKMPEATAAAIDAEGWLHTGDLARRDSDGNYKITGRIKDMIIRGGENIYPKEIEDFLYTHPKVSDVQVVGVPSRAYGEEIMAWVILKPGESSSEDEMKRYVFDHMAKHKVPSYVHFTDSFPMNAAGKIMKYKMREAAVELLGLQSESKIVTA
ncbi:MAG: AMP-binding protein [Firmicutes bacterium]|nr:AMP-binding protein [Bacillota bacterium]